MLVNGPKVHLIRHTRNSAYLGNRQAFALYGHEHYTWRGGRGRRNSDVTVSCVHGRQGRCAAPAAAASPVAGTEHEERGVGWDGLDLGGLHQLREPARPRSQRHRLAVSLCNRRRTGGLESSASQRGSPVGRREHIETTERRHRLDALLDGERRQAARPHRDRQLVQFVGALGVRHRGQVTVVEALFACGRSRGVRAGREAVGFPGGGASNAQ